MIDNYDLIRGALEFASEDDYYFVEVIQRRKDFLDGADVRSQTCMGTFMVTSPEKYARLEHEIKALCRMHNARAYINLNRKSFRQTTVILADQLFRMMAEGDCHRLASRLDSAAGLCKPAKDMRKFLVDVDSRDDRILDTVVALICDVREGDFDRLVVPTVNGRHIICRPFDVVRFNELMSWHDEIQPGTVEIKHNSPTLLYYAGAGQTEETTDDRQIVS